MKDIQCPNCGTTFQVDDSVYASIIEQVRTKEFNDELVRRSKDMEERFRLKEESLKANADKEHARSLSQKDVELEKLRSELARLNGIISGFDATKKNELVQLAAAKEKELFEAISAKDKQISDLKATIAGSEQAHRVALLEERNAVAGKVQEKEKSIIELQSKLEAGKLEAENREKQLCDLHRLQLQDKQAEIDRLKDFRLRLSTKMVGESLEHHCSIEFDKARSQGLYPEATFEKDNISVEGTKGDFIFRDYCNGEEYVSIMFEMKNEMDTTATKHTNDHFLDKLHKDRERKNCEYAILVSMLELDNELYNTGIVDKSYRYPKMMVIRPQFFMQVIRLISECAKKGYLERYALVKELETARSNSADFSTFEKRIAQFRDDFNKNVAQAHSKYVAANKGIDKIIENLEKQITLLREVRANFEASEQKLLKANELTEERLTVKKLTYGAPSIRRMIEDARGE